MRNRKVGRSLLSTMTAVQPAFCWDRSVKDKRKTFPTPVLTPLDMSLAKEHQHPDINSKDTYLCLIDGRYFTGKFSKVWFGWSFDGWHNDLQFDAPGWNSSGWQQIWKLDGPQPGKVQHPEDKCQNKGCTGRLKTLKTHVGDPEGIRSDLQCRKCGQYYGCTKASIHPMSKSEYERGRDDEL
jgi:hypothetical protein